MSRSKTADAGTCGGDLNHLERELRLRPATFAQIPIVGGLQNEIGE